MIDGYSDGPKTIKADGNTPIAAVWGFVAGFVFSVAVILGSYFFHA